MHALSDLPLLQDRRQLADSGTGRAGWEREGGDTGRARTEDKTGDEADVQMVSLLTGSVTLMLERKSG